MRFTWTILLLLPIMLLARENPFASATDTKQTSTTVIDAQKTLPKQTSKVRQSRIDNEKDTAQQSSKPKVHPQHLVNIDQKVTTAKIHPQRKLGKKEILNFAKARFIFRENSAYIETKDKMIRHFSIANPPSIVIDFRGASDFASKRKALRTKPFTKLEMGAHGNRYRVVLRLDKIHQYKIDKRKYGQVVTIIK